MNIILVVLALLIAAALIHFLIGDHRREVCFRIHEKLRVLRLATAQLRAAYRQRLWLPEEDILRATIADQLDAVEATLSSAASAVPEGYYGTNHTAEQLAAIDSEVDKALEELNRIRRQVQHPYADDDEQN